MAERRGWRRLVRILPPAPPRMPVGGVTGEALRPAPGAVVSDDLPRRRRILAIALPVVLSNLLSSLALAVDLAFVGVLGPDALAAAGFATQVYALTLAVATGLAAGATALVARAYGAGDVATAHRVAWYVTLASFATGLAFTLALLPTAAPLVRAVGADAAVADPSVSFLVLLGAGLPANFVMIALTGAFYGAGDTRPGLVAGVVVNVVNVVGDWVLIFGNLGAPALGLRGAAIATALSYVAGAVLLLALLARGRRPLRLAFEAPRPARFASLARVGAPAAAEALVLSLGFTAYLVLILHFGAAALAAHSIGLRAQSFAFLPGFGFATAAAALVGQGLGAGDPARAEADGWYATKLGIALMTGFSLPLVLFARPVAGVFTSDPDALALGATWIRAILLAMPAIAIHFTVAGALRGAGDTRWPLLVSFVGLWVVRLPLAWVLAVPLGLGMTGVWAAYIVEYYGRAGAIALRFRRGGWKTTRV